MSTELFICKHCNKKYSSLSSLNHHQKHAKYCLQLQNKDLSFSCEHCNKEFSSLYILQTHLSSCKTKKLSEANNVIQERDFYKMRVLQLEEQVKWLKEQNTKFMDNTLSSHTTNSNNTINSNNTTINNNNNIYKSQYNALFNNLVVFNCNNVVNSIKELITDENISKLELNDIQRSIIDDLVENSINKFVFCTDSRRKVMVMKNATGDQTKTKLVDFLAEYVHYGKDEIHNYLEKSHTYINEVINNDELPDDNIWYNFERTKNELHGKIKSLYTADNIKDTDLVKDIHSQVVENCIKIKKGTT